MGLLEKRVVIVTGGGHGIGRAFCLALGSEGARVVIAELDADAAQATAEDLRTSGSDALAVQTDVSDEASVKELVRQVLDRYGGVDALVNNAAIFNAVPLSQVPVDEIALAEWDRVMAVNLRGVFLTTRAVLPAMKAKLAGKIVNISSASFFDGAATLRFEGLGAASHYVASKAGVIGFTRAVAMELGAFGITVNCIAPGSTLSSANPSAEMIRVRQARSQRLALGRPQIPGDLVGPLIFFCSAASDFVTGQTLVVDGGGQLN